MKKYFVSAGNAIGPYSDLLPGYSEALAEARERGRNNFPDGNFIVWTLIDGEAEAV